MTLEDVIGSLPFTLVDEPIDDPTSVCVDDVDAAQRILLSSIAHSPAAASVALDLLSQPKHEIGVALAAESFAYSALQGGPEFERWLAGHTRKPPAVEGDPLLLRRDSTTLHITLNRPHKRNALNAAMRESLLDAFAIALSDPALRVAIDGAGPSFCAGGDLDEFGTFENPARAHLVRLERSLAAPLFALGPRTSVRLHGRCAGAGIELPAFAHDLSATADATFLLPELALGLIPGAGGTVSIPARIGAARTAWMLLSGIPIDASTALDWGLIDAIDE